MPAGGQVGVVALGYDVIGAEVPDSLSLKTEQEDESACCPHVDGQGHVKVAIDGQGDYPAATYVSDPAYAGVTIGALIDADATAEDGDKLTYLFLADATTMADDAHPLLAVDLYDEPGRTFRVPPHWYHDVSANLCIASLDFADFADAVDKLRYLSR